MINGWRATWPHAICTGDSLAVPATNSAQKPWVSKERVNRAGEAVRRREQTPDDLAVINIWRASHNWVMNTFQANLRQRARGGQIVVAQRLKRRYTIFNKLDREPKMQLARMNDVAGCRLIFNTIEELTKFRISFHKAKFAHRRRNEDDKDKYDYIKKPKASGYRGIHDIYEYCVNSKEGRKYNGLLVEIQYRIISTLGRLPLRLWALLPRISRSLTVEMTRIFSFLDWQAK
jgi:putative GTP pyrophosphokinase